MLLGSPREEIVVDGNDRPDVAGCRWGGKQLRLCSLAAHHHISLFLKTVEYRHSIQMKVREA